MKVSVHIVSVLSASCPVGEVSCVRTILSMNCPTANYPVGELSVGELSVSELSVGVVTVGELSVGKVSVYRTICDGFKVFIEFGCEE